MNKLQILQWLNEEEIRTSQVLTKYFMNRLAHIGIKVHRIDEINIRILLREVLHGSYHTDKSITKILTAMSGNQHQLLAVVKTGDIITSLKKNLVLLLGKCSIIVELINNHMQCIYYGITRNINLTMSLLFEQILF